ncbi:MAG: ATP-binding protein [Gemmatimonadetes bacterium]|nr:ATP-binding protein [Gemmatimonadota bacterium]
MGETRVDLLHLLEDLRDAYPGSLEETILTEIVANSLDSSATAIALITDAAASTLTVADDGAGMTRRELARYHDLAATTKQRGRGIGFAGVGIKLGLLACETVLTETRRGPKHVATEWHLKSRHRAPWRWVPPAGIVDGRGTGVRLRLGNPLSPLLDEGFLEATLRHHYRPLLDPGFDDILSASYPAGVQFTVNGRRLEREQADLERATVVIKLARKRKPSAYGYLTRSAEPLPEDQRGVAVSTLGKVIKRGWDWLGVSPAAIEHVTGCIEAPALAECLTLNKADFLRTGQRGATFLAYRKAIQEVVSEQLAAWGDARDHAAEAQRRRARPVERDLRNVLVDLAHDFPLLATLVDVRAGGQRKLALGRAKPNGALKAGAAVPLSMETTPAAEETPETSAVVEPKPPREPEAETRTPPAEAEAMLPGAGPRRPARYGLTIQFESRPDDEALGRLVESTVWVNDAHPAYRRAAQSRSEGYHLALAVAMALAPLAVEPGQAHGFVTAFMTRWGEEAATGRKAVTVGCLVTPPAASPRIDPSRSASTP